jgi:hypothetical protein
VNASHPLEAEVLMRLIGLAVAVAFSLALATLAVEAQQTAKVYHIGVLTLGVASSTPLAEAFRQGLRDLGYVEGQNLIVEHLSSEGRFERLTGPRGAGPAETRRHRRAKCVERSCGPARALEFSDLRVRLTQLAGGTTSSLA